MNVSAKTEYACIAVVELAVRHGAEKPTRIREIAEANGIPSRFLVQILLQMKSAGLVASIRGAAGGYRLARDPAEITLADVMSVCDGQLADPASSTDRDTPAARTLLAAWHQVATAERRMLEAITLADLVERVTGQTENMYYI